MVLSICRAAGTESLAVPLVSKASHSMVRPSTPPASLISVAAGRHPLTTSAPSTAVGPLKAISIPTTSGSSSPPCEQAGTTSNTAAAAALDQTFVALFMSLPQSVFATNV